MFRYKEIKTWCHKNLNISALKYRFEGTNVPFLSVQDGPKEMYFSKSVRLRVIAVYLSLFHLSIFKKIKKREKKTPKTDFSAQWSKLLS